MTVKELIEFLQTQPQEIQVAYRCCSEYDILDAKYIEIKELCAPRPDGWVQAARPDMQAFQYLCFPSN